MKTILASVLALATLAGPAFADGPSRDVLPSIYAMQQIPGEARQAIAPPPTRSRDFPDRGYGADSSHQMLLDVQRANQSGRYTAPSWTPQAVR